MVAEWFSQPDWLADNGTSIVMVVMVVVVVAVVAFPLHARIIEKVRRIILHVRFFSFSFLFF